ncbi:amino acid-binding protein [Haloplanus ruber]|uniref:Amino acid-binding protein n=1 Tax=Haloplanus ruber TaxID=869892 RepID=A0ABD6CX79_9EURY|nr:amino acid-binding protein [Haloplanus ruber]
MVDAGDAETEAATTDDAETDADEERTDGGERSQTHTIRLELVDKPGELLSALHPIAENGGNLLSIFHERGNLTPRGHIPVEVDVECPPERFETIVDALRAEGVNVIQAGAERYGEELTLLLVGDIVDTDLSDTLQRIESSTDAALADLSLSAPEGRGGASSARLRLATRTGRSDEVFEHVRQVADEKDLNVVEPLVEVAE